MSKIPDTKKPKYNHNNPFRWVDSQWEKFMTQQKEHKAMIKQLQEDLVTCNEHFQAQRKQMEKLVSRVPSAFLTGLISKYPNDSELGNKIRTMSWKTDEKNDNFQMDLFED
tara:strand:+ start:2156 stop:2488 length:333 start_codon:yes stop_codon:yes gene_type:complete